jgi:hypothetical protein
MYPTHLDLAVPPSEVAVQYWADWLRSHPAPGDRDPRKILWTEIDHELRLIGLTVTHEHLDRFLDRVEELLVDQQNPGLM